MEEILTKDKAGEEDLSKEKTIYIKRKSLKVSPTENVPKSASASLHLSTSGFLRVWHEHIYGASA